MKKSITKTEYQALIGLLTIAKEHTNALNSIEAAMRKITGEKAKYGHCGDAIYSNYPADELLGKLEIRVK
jgi:hypothetical protein